MLWHANAALCCCAPSLCEYICLDKIEAVYRLDVVIVVVVFAVFAGTVCICV